MAVSIYTALGNRITVGPSSGGVPVLPTQGVELSNMINPVVLSNSGVSLAASQIKTLYESNANTNAFTDALLSKLTGLVGQVNADWNAVSGLSQILNKPTIPTIPANIVIDAAYVHTDNNYTTTEKTKLGTLAPQVQINWNDTSGITSIANKPAYLVNDQYYVHTDNNYTTTDKNKLATINAQVQADWSLGSGIGSILNKPSIPEDFQTATVISNTFNCDHLYNYSTITISSAQTYNFNLSGAILECGGSIAFVADGISGHEPVFSNGYLSSGGFDNTVGKTNVLTYVYLPGGILSYNWIVGMVDSAEVDQTVIPGSTNPVSSSGVVAYVAAHGGSSSWGSITGTLSAQTDLNAALGLKAPIANPSFTGSLQLVSDTNKGVMIGPGTYPAWMGTDGLYVNGQFRANSYIVGTVGLLFGSGSTQIVGIDNGTTDSYLSFWTGRGVAQGERIRIIDNGNVGIGTTNPQQKLDVNGDINIKSDSRYMYNGIQVVQAQTALNNYYFGGSGNLSGTGGENFGFGLNALSNISSGSANNAFGNNALGHINIGNSNIGIGYATLFNIAGGNYNIAIGHNSGRFISGGVTINTTSDSSIFIGSSTYPLTSGDVNEIVIGHNAVGLGSNTMVLGNSSITKTAIYGNVGISMVGATARLHLPAGTSGAGGAALKFEDGVALTVKEAGTVTRHDGHLWFTATNGGSEFQLDQQSGGGGISDADAIMYAMIFG